MTVDTDLAMWSYSEVVVSRESFIFDDSESSETCPVALPVPSLLGTKLPRLDSNSGEPKGEDRGLGSPAM